MSIDNWITHHLNHWGEHHLGLIKVASNDPVYLLIALVGLWLFTSTYKAHRPLVSPKGFILDLVSKSILLLAIPVSIATVASELISKFYVRNRPFVGESGIKLLVPHTADGGMPSHHMVFMVSAVVMIFFYNRTFALALFVLTLISGVARVSAGIHYPSDVIAGVLLGWLVSYAYLFFMRKSNLEFLTHLIKR